MINKTALMEKEAALRKELARIEQLQAFVEDPDSMAYLKSLIGNPVAEQPKLDLAPSPAEPSRYYQVVRKIENMGARRQVTINLLTGPSSVEDLAATMKWDCSLVRTVIGSMRRSGLVGTEGNRFYLTGEGKAQGVWFQRNPGAKQYRPALNGHSK